MPVDEPASLSRDFTTGNDFSVKSRKEFDQGFHYAKNWKPGDQIAALSSAATEAGIYQGIKHNPHQAAWNQVNQTHNNPGLQRRAALYKIYDEYQKMAGTSTDLDTHAPLTMPDPNGATPQNGPGTPPPLQGGMDPARPGGPAPYNGVEPFSQPVAPDPAWKDPKELANQQGTLMGQDWMSPQTMAFRQVVQANLLAQSWEGMNV
jgi:hypothetical protein